MTIWLLMYVHHGPFKKNKRVLGATVNFWRTSEKVGRRFFFINFWFSKFRRVSQIRSRTLISHQIQSFEAMKKSFWIWAPYICKIDCVRNNWDQTLRSGFSIGGVESTPTRITQRSHMPDPIGLIKCGKNTLEKNYGPDQVTFSNIVHCTIYQNKK